MYSIKIGSELEASAIGLGFWRTGGVSAAAADELVGTAFDNGIDFYDTADIYGGGDGERVLGAALKSLGIRDKVSIQTKCGIRKGSFDFSKEYILSAVEGSLQRLGTDHVESLVLHRPDALMEPDEVGEAFDELYSAGKVLHFGVSNENPRQMALLQKGLHRRLIADQLQFGLGFTQMIDEGIFVNTPIEPSFEHDGGALEYCRLNDITIQCWSPLCHGFFGGTFLDDKDNFGPLNDKLAELADKYGVTKSAVAFAWILRHPAKMQALAGTTKADRLAEICRGADIKLTREEWYALYTAATGRRLP